MDADNVWAKLALRPIARRSLLRRAAIGATGLAGTSLVACGSKPGASNGGAASQSGAGNAAGAPQLGGTLQVVSRSNTKTLDPHVTSGGTDRTLQSGALSRPLRFKSGPDPKIAADHDIEPDLALTLESPDAVTWTLKLRHDANFQDIAPVNGHAVEAEDVKQTYVRFLKTPNNPNLGALDMIDATQIDTPASDTVVFRLKYPYAPFQKTLASGVYSWVLPREAVAGAFDVGKQLIGSGPFILESATPDVAYVLKKNPNWYQRGQPYVDGVRFAIVPATAQAEAQFTSGNLDELSAIGINDLDTMKRNNPKARVITTPANNPNPIYVQMGDPTSPFQDIRVRRALSMALDRDAIGKSSFGGQYDTFVFVPPTLGKWALTVKELDPSVAQYFKYNPSEAKKLLDAAGASNLALKFAFIANGPFDEAYRALYQTIGSMLQGIGLKITLFDQDYAQDFIKGGHGSRQGYFDKDVIVFGGVAQYTEADEYVFGYFHSKSTSNQEHLHDPTYDGMIDKARTIVNENDRLKAYIDVQKYLAQQMYAVPTASGLSFTMIPPSVYNYDPSSSYSICTETYAKLWLKK